MFAVQEMNYFMNLSAGVTFPIKRDAGVEITDKFIEMYERARYSNTSLSKEDVLRMKAEGRERINEN